MLSFSLSHNFVVTKEVGSALAMVTATILLRDPFISEYVTLHVYSVPNRRGVSGQKSEKAGFLTNRIINLRFEETKIY